jgi:hypothetical protein
MTGKCCEKQENVVTVKDGWSYVCGVCGRYTYDQPGCFVGREEAIRWIGKELYEKNYRKARRKIQRKKYREGVTIKTLDELKKKKIVYVPAWGKAVSTSFFFSWQWREIEKWINHGRIKTAIKINRRKK